MNPLVFSAGAKAIGALAFVAAAARAADLSASGIPAVRSADAVGAGHGRQ